MSWSRPARKFPPATARSAAIGLTGATASTVVIVRAATIARNGERAMIATTVLGANPLRIDS